MTRCEELQNKIDECVTMAIETSDENLRKFYINASEGFRIKLESLSIKELTEKI